MQCQSPIPIRKEGYIKQWVEVPCGKCLACLEQRRGIWTFRILQELKVAETARFVTLTYTEENLPWTDENGNISTIWEKTGINKYTPNETKFTGKRLEATLDKRDLTNFLKKCRNEIIKEQISHLRGSNKDLKEEAERYLKKSEKTGKWNPKLRYFAAGEYGSKPQKGTIERPHYHIIMFNIPLRWYKWDTIHEEWYSKKLEEIWNKGQIKISEVVRESAHYTAKYTIKSLMDNWPKSDIREKPYAVMSRNPGIGNNYATDEQNTNYHNGSKTSHRGIETGYKQPIGRYLKDKIWPKEEVTSETPGVQIWPRERIEATNKTNDYVKKHKEAEFNKAIRETEGDLYEAEKKILRDRRQQFEEAIRARKLKQLKEKGKL